MNINVNYYVDFIKKEKLTNINKAILKEYKEADIELEINKNVLLRLIYILDGTVTLYINEGNSKFTLTGEIARDILEYLSIDKGNLIGDSSTMNFEKDSLYSSITNSLVEEFIKYLEDDGENTIYNRYIIV